MDKRITGVISYLTIIGWIVAYILGKMEEAKFHMNQALVLGIFTILFNAVLGIVIGVLGAIPLIGFIFKLLEVLNLVPLILVIMGIINALNDVDKELPIIGGIRILK